MKPRTHRTTTRLVLRIVLATYLVIIASGFVLDYFYQFRMGDTALVEYFVRRHQHININYYQANGRQMRYMFTDNEPGKPAILFIHGAPSSSSYFREYLSDRSLRSAANLFAVDRPGYGYSGLGDPEPDVQKQAAMIVPILDSLHRLERPVVLVAASYGTTVAARMAMDYPELVDGLVLLAPSLAPGEEKTYSISYVLESPLFSWAQPRMIHSANVEKLSHETQLRNMLPLWNRITAPVIYFQGTNDDLIYTSNARFARQNLTKVQHLSINMLPKLGHLIAFKAKPGITAAIQQMTTLAGNYYAQRLDEKMDLHESASATAKPVSNASIQ